MKRLATLLLAAGLVLSAATAAQAIEFNARGQWLMGFGVGEGNFVSQTRAVGAEKQKSKSSDKFTANQRLRLWLDAAASENLSGTVGFEIGDQNWGDAGSGGALGADGIVVKVKHAYIDWAIPDTDLKVRMGIQGVVMPSFAGGSAILDDDVTGVTLNYQFNENVGLTVMWMRPFNDNYSSEGTDNSNDKTSYLDNFDLFSVALPVSLDGFEITPWVMYGLIGQNAAQQRTDTGYEPFYASFSGSRWNVTSQAGRGADNTSAFWFGIPLQVSALDPINIEFDLNYGFMQSQGRGWLTSSEGVSKRFDTRRQGWLAKALVEYKMDWGTPGIFGWYASGDDDNPKNGSERMPSISACGTFTSFMGDGNEGWSSDGALYDRNLAYAGTWGIGLQLADMSFVDNLTHTFRVAYWGGTNSPEMAKYANNPWDYGSDVEAGTGEPDLYLTTNDGLLEFNLVNVYQMYDNFQINFELGYIVNFIDEDTWKDSVNGALGATVQSRDAWKAQVIFAYSY